jgi:adsorption protein B
MAWGLRRDGGCGLALSTAGLEWLVQGAGYELMLFASVGILLFGIDDLLFDAVWIASPRRASPAIRGDLADLEDATAPPMTGTFAIFVPAWDEAPVLPAMLCRTLAAWNGEDFRIYIGCYPNDAATLKVVAPMVGMDPRLRLVVGDRDGPTTKGDNLNRLWGALGADERAEGRRFGAVVLHDAEDHVHRDELALYRRYLADHAMVQIPVVPSIVGGSAWIGGHYGDEFAEAHGKELPLRSALGMPMPSAGVGTALTRDALAVLALHRDGHPFSSDSLTEDYEVGILIGAYGMRASFVDAVAVSGDPIVSRGAFPGAVEAAVRQKARWIAGVALAGWEDLGWLWQRRGGARLMGWRAWFARWMLWRDRRSPLAAVILLAAYAGMLLAAVGWVGQAMLGWRGMVIDDPMRLLLAVDAALLLWRLTMRAHFTARWYGRRQALMAFPRAFVANIIAMMAARRAILLYVRMLRSGEVIWDKTDHSGGVDSDAIYTPHVSEMRVS